MLKGLQSSPKFLKNFSVFLTICMRIKVCNLSYLYESMLKKSKMLHNIMYLQYQHTYQTYEGLT